MDSSTTMDESTSMPIPRARPPRDMMLRDTPSRWRGAKVTARETGIARAMINVERTLARNRKSTTTASRPPRMAADLTSAMEPRMNTDGSATTPRRTPSWS